MQSEPFRPQSVGRALRTAFVLGLMLVVALLAGVEAVHQFNALVGNNSKDELSRYLDDNAHTTARPSGAGFQIDFPVPASRKSETVRTTGGTITAPRDTALVDDEITFDVLWFDVPGALPPTRSKLVSSLVTLQVHHLGGTKIAGPDPRTVKRASGSDFVVSAVDRTGATHYFEERILVSGRHVWIIRVGSRIRRDEAFRVFADSFTFTS